MKGKRMLAGRVFAAFAAAALLILGCGPSGGNGPGPWEPPVNGADCGTEVPDPTDMVVGCLVDEDKLPVRGFSVKANILQPNSYPGYHENAFQVVESTTTDSAGRFRFRKVTQGEYYFTAQEGSVRSMPTFKLNLSGDTLVGTQVLYRNGLILGTLRGKQDGKPLQSVLCVVQDKLNAVGSQVDGRFELYLPPGRETLVCGVGRTDMIEARAEVEVRPGDTTLVDMSLTLLTDEDRARPPGPTGISYWYDAATGIVHLSWPRVAPAASGIVYVLKRTDLSISSQANLYFTTPDTFHSDVIYWPKDQDGVVRTRPKLIIYSLATAYQNNLVYYSNAKIDTQISVNSPLFLGPEVEVTLLGDKDTFLVGDTARLVGTWRNPYRENRHLAWTRESDGTELKPRWDLPGSAGADTLVFPCTTSGKLGIRFKVTDNSGAAASVLQILEIESAP